MSNKKFAVLGATGKIGHVVAEELLKKGHKVRAIGRDVTAEHKGTTSFESFAQELAHAF